MTGMSFNSGLVLGSTTGLGGIYFASPVRDSDARVIGVVVLRLKGSSITAMLDEIHAGDPTLSATAVDSDGILVAYPDATRLYASLKELPPETLQRLIAGQRFRRTHFDNLQMPALADTLMQATKPDSLSYHSTLSGTDEVAGYAPVNGARLVIAVTEPLSRFEAPLQRLFKNVLYFIAAVGMFFLVMVVGLARSVVRPVLRLTAAAQALKNGEFDKARLPADSSRHVDEVGQLSRTFSVMIDVLRQREQSAARALGRARKQKD